jgi:hypothetical protein
MSEQERRDEREELELFELGTASEETQGGTGGLKEGEA